MVLTHHPTAADRLERTRSGPVRVASVPASHVYVRHLEPVDGPQVPRVLRLGDPDPGDPTATTTSGWWPPAMLDPQWVGEHADDFDVFHLQFGFDACSPEQLADLVRTLRALGKPIVHTAHDLRNPHHRSRDLHDAQLDVLLGAADAVLTLTPGAAREIAVRWGREARVLPHPHVVELDTMRALARERTAPRLRDGGFRVGLHVKSLRACMDPLAVLPVLVRAVQQVPGGVLQVDGHTDVLDPAGERHDPELVAALSAAPDCVDVRVHDYFSDDELVDYLAGLDLSVLPYRFGTHSGWLELCRDLGTPVAAPTCGYYAQQGPVLAFTMDEERLDEDSLVEAVLRAWREVPAPAETVAARRAQRDAVAAAHADLYDRLLGER